MNKISRYIVRYRVPYSLPAKYVSHTKFSIETTDGERHEFTCGSLYGSYKKFIRAMSVKYGTSKINIDTLPPYVIYQ